MSCVPEPWTVASFCATWKSMVQGRSAGEVASLPREELLDELGIPLSPVRLKCALLGLSTLKLALHKAKGTPLPEEWAGAAGDLDLK